RGARTLRQRGGTRGSTSGTPLSGSTGGLSQKDRTATRIKRSTGGESTLALEGLSSEKAAHSRCSKRLRPGRRPPQAHLGAGLVGRAAGVAEQLELQARGGEEVDEGQPGRRPRRQGGRLAQDVDAALAQVADGGGHVLDVEGDVVAADVAVGRAGAGLLRGNV